MPKKGWVNIAFTASDELVEFIEQWQAKKQLKTRPAAVRDLLELVQKQLENPEEAPATRKDLREQVRDALREVFREQGRLAAAESGQSTGAKRPETRRQ